MRLLVVIETTPEKMQSLIDGSPDLQKQIGNEWVQLALLDPDSNRIWNYRQRQFSVYEPENREIEAVDSSIEWYQGLRIISDSRWCGIPCGQSRR